MSDDNFTFTGADGETYSLPKKIPTGALRVSRNLEFLDAAFTVLEYVATDPAVLSAIDGLDSKVGMNVINSWMQGLSAPNLSSSSTSSKSTESPSPATSANDSTSQ